MRVIITGGTGLIGRELATSLAADKHEVILLTRNPQKASGLPHGVRAARWDGRTPNGWGGLVEGAGAIVNLAGESIAGNNPVLDRWTESRKQLLLGSRLDAGKAVTEAVRNATQKPGVLIQSSAVGYYGPCGDEEVPETHPAGNDFLAKLCVQWETSTNEVEAVGVRRVILRTGLPLSTKGGFFPPVLTIWKLFAGGPMGSGNHYWPWLHMADQVASIRFLIDNSNANGAFNISAPNPVRQKDFGKVLGKVLGRPSFMPTPAFALKLMMGELAEALLLSGQREVPTRLEQLGYAFKFPTLEPALRDTLK
jgi:uncharacterized protein (TIGR01777 family)